MKLASSGKDESVNLVTLSKITSMVSKVRSKRMVAKPGSLAKHGSLAKPESLAALFSFILISYS